MCYSFRPPLISETVRKFDVGSKLLPFYMTIDIAYFLYILVIMVLICYNRELCTICVHIF